jgi:hypothetical protein
MIGSITLRRNPFCHASPSLFQLKAARRLWTGQPPLSLNHNGPMTTRTMLSNGGKVDQVLAVRIARTRKERFAKPTSPLSQMTIFA